jgi:hypothetical protein
MSQSQPTIGWGLLEKLKKNLLRLGTKPEATDTPRTTGSLGPSGH